MIPHRNITTEADLEVWKASAAFEAVAGFVEQLQALVVGLDNDALVPVLRTVEQLLQVMDEVAATVERHPVVREKDVLRFGKVEFRDFHDDVVKNAPNLLGDLCPSHVEEVAAYFGESWGNRTRIDYGSGHELNFIAFLLCLDKLGVIGETDHAAIILKVFTKYMSIMRSLQKQYWLEPAGSHGVWGLDDYHFLPFLFGAAQLATHPHMKPKSIHNDELVDMFHSKYMYLECIHFINNIKLVPNNSEKLSLRWHLPMLDDILAAKSWDKIRAGMIKMYRVEVLGKLPIVQHFMFGELIEAPEGLSDPDDAHADHVHTWGDCCGIKVPSGIAASEAVKRSKPVPFD